MRQARRPCRHNLCKKKDKRSPAFMQSKLSFVLDESTRETNRTRFEKRPWEHCAVYEDELKRVWPLDQKDREAKIAQFAKEYGFRLRHYKRDFVSSSISGRGKPVRGADKCSVVLSRRNGQRTTKGEELNGDASPVNGSCFAAR